MMSGDFVEIHLASHLIHGSCEEISIMFESKNPLNYVYISTFETGPKNTSNMFLPVWKSD